MLRKLAILMALSLSIFFVSRPVAAVVCTDPNLSPQDALLCGSCGAGSEDCKTPGTSETKIENTVKSIIDLFSLAVGVIAVIMIIIGGFRYITSGGTAEKVTSAKNTILYAIIGLVIVALAQVIVKFTITETNTATSNVKCANGKPPDKNGECK